MFSIPVGSIERLGRHDGSPIDYGMTRTRPSRDTTTCLRAPPLVTTKVALAKPRVTPLGANMSVREGLVMLTPDARGTGALQTAVADTPVPTRRIRESARTVSSVTRLSRIARIRARLCAPAMAPATELTVYRSRIPARAGTAADEISPTTTRPKTSSIRLNPCLMRQPKMGRCKVRHPYTAGRNKNPQHRGPCSASQGNNSRCGYSS